MDAHKPDMLGGIEGRKSAQMPFNAQLLRKLNDGLFFLTNLVILDKFSQHDWCKKGCTRGQQQRLPAVTSRPFVAQNVLSFLSVSSFHYFFQHWVKLTSRWFVANPLPCFYPSGSSPFNKKKEKNKEQIPWFAPSKQWSHPLAQC